MLARAGQMPGPSSKVLLGGEGWDLGQDDAVRIATG